MIRRLEKIKSIVNRLHQQSYEKGWADAVGHIEGVLETQISDIFKRGQKEEEETDFAEGFFRHGHTPIINTTIARPIPIARPIKR